VAGASYDRSFIVALAQCRALAQCAQVRPERAAEP
jgi:hypothetical protein